jgi:glycosyltransferase involved in cell wall biosynthesis
VRAYWYWPYLRREELVLAEGFLRPGDELVVHTTPRPSDPITSPGSGCLVDSSLPAVRDRAEGTARWVASRATTYWRRAAVREAAVRRGAFDVAHVVYLNPFTDGLTLGRLGRRVPLVSTVHDVVPHMRRVPRAVERRLLRAEYRNAGTILVHHESVRRRLVREHPVDPARVFEVPLPIALRPGAESPPPPEGPPTVLFFGTFRRNKGIDVLLDAIGRVPSERPARFVFAGRGFADVERRVQDAAARDARVEVELGYASAARKDELYAAADLVVLPYTSFSSQSAVLQDAYAHGVPVIVSDVGALGETVRAEHTGWVVRPGRVDELAAALDGALGDDAARARARAASVEVARMRTPEAVGDALRRVYEHAIGR